MKISLLIQKSWKTVDRTKIRATVGCKKVILQRKEISDRIINLLIITLLNLKSYRRCLCLSQIVNY